MSFSENVTHNHYSAYVCLYYIGRYGQEGIAWKDTGSNQWYTHTLAQWMGEVRCSPGFFRNLTTGPNTSNVSWLRCAECETVSFLDYLCKECRNLDL